MERFRGREGAAGSIAGRRAGAREYGVLNSQCLPRNDRYPRFQFRTPPAPAPSRIGVPWSPGTDPTKVGHGRQPGVSPPVNRALRSRILLDTMRRISLADQVKTA